MDGWIEGKEGEKERGTDRQVWQASVDFSKKLHAYKEIAVVIAIRERLITSHEKPPYCIRTYSMFHAFD